MVSHLEKCKYSGFLFLLRKLWDEDDHMKIKLYYCDLSLKLRPNIMCGLDIWGNWEGPKLPNFKISCSLCSHG